jgi:membrane fusion protein (multidrug efflux system)
LSFIVGALLLAFAVDATAQQRTGNSLPSVVVAPVEKRDVTPRFNHVGRVEAVDTVDIRARVSGFLELRNFEEGAIVKKTDLLFLIEQGTYQVAVDQRKADLAKADAVLKNAAITRIRKEKLKRNDFASQSALDAAMADEASAKAQVMQARAALRQADLDLSYTMITSPIGGRISRAKYSVGNLVEPSSDPLARVTTLDPVYVTIAVSEKLLIQARRQGFDLKNPRFAPMLELSDGSKYEHRGEFNYVDTAVNQATDTLLLRAAFPNPSHVLVPGEFVRVVVESKQTERALVVPQAAVQRDREGHFVLTVDRENKVRVRRVSLGDQVDQVWIVKDGLTEGDRIIVQGLQKVRAGGQVNAVEK